MYPIMGPIMGPVMGPNFTGDFYYDFSWFLQVNRQADKEIKFGGHYTQLIIMYRVTRISTPELIKYGVPGIL